MYKYFPGAKQFGDQRAKFLPRGKFQFAKTRSHASTTAIIFPDTFPHIFPRFFPHTGCFLTGPPQFQY